LGRIHGPAHGRTGEHGRMGEQIRILVSLANELMLLGQQAIF
jgi:hypothetical protein